MAEKNIKYEDHDGWVNSQYVGEKKALDFPTVAKRSNGALNTIITDRLEAEIELNEDGQTEKAFNNTKDGYDHIRETKRKTTLIPDRLLFNEETEDPDDMVAPFEETTGDGT